MKRRRQEKIEDLTVNRNIPKFESQPHSKVFRATEEESSAHTIISTLGTTKVKIDLEIVR
jgi:hypothetical protein